MNVFLKRKYVFNKSKKITTNPTFIHKKVLRLLQSFPFYCTPVPYNSYSILEHFLASFPYKISQNCVRDVDLSDHQLIICTRETAKPKSYCHKKYFLLFWKLFTWGFWRGSEKFFQQRIIWQHWRSFWKLHSKVHGSYWQSYNE